MKYQDNVLVTLANEEYIDQAKQLFSSVYLHSGWEGDYVLLFDGLNSEKLSWFTDRGIIVHIVGDDLIRKKWNIRFSLTTLCKFYLFTDYFKKWKRVVYLDADIIVRGSLQYLVSSKNMFLGANNFHFTLSTEFRDDEVKKELSLFYELDRKSFCSGVMSFNTSIVTDDDFGNLVSLYDKYGHGVACADQGILNLFFYEIWDVLPFRFNVSPNQITQYKVYPDYFTFHFSIFNGNIIHLLGFPKPWEKKSDFYGEWKKNLDLANSISFTKPSLFHRESYSLRMKRSEIYLLVKSYFS
jgi:lipopolysaccharide biosynthesis glycosyltransferase